MISAQIEDEKRVFEVFVGEVVRCLSQDPADRDSKGSRSYRMDEDRRKLNFYPL
jgi:hypothetical protein